MAFAVKHGRQDGVCSGVFSGLGRHGDERAVSLNVLLLGGRQSGRSSVGNALIGGEEFQTGPSLFGVSTTTECKLLRRNFRKFFRRQGAESDLLLSVIDTPPQVQSPQSVHELCPEGVHVLMLVVRADLLYADAHLEERAQALVGPEWRRHALLTLTFADHLEGAGLQPSEYLKHTSDWLRALAAEVEGGVFFMDNSCDWPSIRGRGLRERVLHLSARNHHKALSVGTDVSL